MYDEYRSGSALDSPTQSISYSTVGSTVHVKIRTRGVVEMVLQHNEQRSGLWAIETYVPQVPIYAFSMFFRSVSDL